MIIYAEQVVSHHLLAPSSHPAYCSNYGHGRLASQIKRLTCRLLYVSNSAVNCVPLHDSIHRTSFICFDSTSLLILQNHYQVRLILFDIRSDLFFIALL